MNTDQRYQLDMITDYFSHLEVNAAMKGNKDIWILDSSMIENTSHRRKYFEDFMKISELAKIGNGDRIFAQSKSDVSIRTFNAIERIRKFVLEILFVLIFR